MGLIFPSMKYVVEHCIEVPVSQFDLPITKTTLPVSKNLISSIIGEKNHCNVIHDVM